MLLTVVIGQSSAFALHAQSLGARSLTIHALPGPVLAKLTASSAASLVLNGSPLHFVENAGQFRSAARHQALGTREGALWLAQDGLWLSLVLAEAASTSDDGVIRYLRTLALSPDEMRHDIQLWVECGPLEDVAKSIRSVVLHEESATPEG